MIHVLGKTKTKEEIGSPIKPQMTPRSNSQSLFGRSIFSRQKANEIRESSKPSLEYLRYSNTLKKNMSMLNEKNNIYSDRRGSRLGSIASKRAKSI